MARSALHDSPTLCLRYAITFILIGAGFVAITIMNGGWAWLAVWPAISFVAIGLAYFKLGPKCIGKRPDGRRPIWSHLVFEPYFLFTGIIWLIAVSMSHKEPFHMIVPGVWLGRRLNRNRLPESITHVVDLTAEHHEPASIRRTTHYRCFPVLDYTAPSPEALHEIVRFIDQADGDVFVHCALGHGRSATAVAAYLLHKGLVDSIDQAVEKMVAIRRGVHLNISQRDALQRYVESLNKPE